MIYIGIDNGVTGSIGIINNGVSDFILTPVKTEQSYTKAKQNISRIDYPKLYQRLEYFEDSVEALVERPMVNPTRFKASASGLRALEATIIMLEELNIGYSYIDSKEWQKALLPKGIKGAAKLKKASLDISCRIFPQHKKVIKKRGDGDGILIAEYLRWRRGGKSTQ